MAFKNLLPFNLLVVFCPDFVWSPGFVVHLQGWLMRSFLVSWRILADFDAVAKTHKLIIRES